MLKGVLIQAHVVVVIIGIRKKLVLDREDIAGRDVVLWQKKPVGLQDGHDLVPLITKVLSLFVTKVGIDILIADYFEWLLYANRSVVGGDNHTRFVIGYLLHDFQQRRMDEPGFRDGPIGRFIRGKFSHHCHIGAGVRKHVHEIIDNDVQVIRK